MSLRHTVLLGMLVLGIGPVVILTAAYQPNILGYIQQSATDHALSQSKSTLDQIARRLNNRKQVISTLSILPIYPEIIGIAKIPDIHLLSPETATARYVSVMRRWFGNYHDVVGISILDEHGLERLHLARSGAQELRPVHHKEPSRLAQAPCFKSAISGDPDTVHVFLVDPRKLNHCYDMLEGLYLYLSKRLSATDGTSIGVLLLALDLHPLIEATPASYWVLEDGTYIRSPSNLDQREAGNLFKQSPQLLELFAASNGQAVHHTEGDSTIIWSHLITDPIHHQGLWVGVPVDDSAFTRALDHFIKLALITTLGLLVTVMIISYLVANRVEAAKNTIIGTVDRMIQRDSDIDFQWKGPRELQSLGSELELLNKHHAAEEEARKGAEKRLYAEKERVVALNETLERKVEERTEALETLNRELKAFSYSVSHDLRAPLRSINGFSEILLDEYTGTMDDEAVNYIQRIRSSGKRMSTLIDDLLSLSMVNRQELRLERVDLSAHAREITDRLQQDAPARKASISIQADLFTQGDEQLLHIALENLLSNAWKYTSQSEQARIEFGCKDIDDTLTYYIADNGAGFDMDLADSLFAPFQRLHDAQVYEGTGIGLATVQRIIERHGGRIWAEGDVGKGATFYFQVQAKTGRHPDTDKT